MGVTKEDIWREPKPQVLVAGVGWPDGVFIRGMTIAECKDWNARLGKEQDDALAVDVAVTFLVDANGKQLCNGDAADRQAFRAMPAASFVPMMRAFEKVNLITEEAHAEAAKNSNGRRKTSRSRSRRT